MTRYIYRPPEYKRGPVERAVQKLTSYQSGDLAVIEVVACGDAAIPALRTMLFTAEPSGVYQTRIRAVDALSRLGASKVLIEYLSKPRTIADPVERVGEDAVINAAARATAKVDDPALFPALLDLAKRLCLSGVIFALGASARREVVPILIAALGEDESRRTAEKALKAFGSAANQALIETALPRTQDVEHQSESRLRQRRSALILLSQRGDLEHIWPAVQPLIHDTDAAIAVTACGIAIEAGAPTERDDAVVRLVEIYCQSDWSLRDDIERCLNAHAPAVRGAEISSAELRQLVAQLGPAASLVGRFCHAPMAV